MAGEREIRRDRDAPGPVELRAGEIGQARRDSTSTTRLAEALTNVVKHARATRAAVRASAGGGVLAIEVRDDGAGGADPRGHGLVGIADRVAALGGRLRIDSLGRGTVVAAELPVPSD
jgi:glucose-6-phosphate-specific signal transduction histidine kinase